MYDRAIAMKERTEHNITTCYKTAISDYVATRANPEFYKTLINSIHYYTRVSTIYSDLSFVDCINLYASLFIPEVYIKSLTEKQKHDMLSMVLRETIKSFSDQLLADYLAVIIDEHEDPTNIPLLQDCILKELIKHRDHSYSRFINCEKKPLVKKATVGVKLETRTSVVGPKAQKTLTKISKLYKKALDEKYRMKVKHIDLQIKYKSLVEQSKELQSMLLNQIKLYKDQEVELAVFKKSLASTNNQRSIKDYRPSSLGMKDHAPNGLSAVVSSTESSDYDDGLFAVEYNE
jgi:hypothetical protein